VSRVIVMALWRIMACLAQLQRATDPKNQFHSKFFLSNTPSSNSCTADLLQEKVESLVRPQIHGFGGVPLESLYKTKFGGVGGNHPPLLLISGENSLLLFSRDTSAATPLAPLPRSPGRR
jgi:hypothetical protein